MSIPAARALGGLMACLLQAASPAQGSPSGPPAERPRVTEEMRQRVEKQREQTDAEDASRTAADAAEIFLLEPVTVKADSENDPYRLEHQQPESRPFSWREGGTIWRDEGEAVTAEFMFQYDPENSIVRLFSVSW